MYSVEEKLDESHNQVSTSFQSDCCGRVGSFEEGNSVEPVTDNVSLEPPYIRVGRKRQTK